MRPLSPLSRDNQAFFILIFVHFSYQFLVDFFGIEKYPLSTFKISSVESLQTEGAYKIKGDLTIKETTLEETVVAKVVFDGEMVIVTANFDIDRTKYNVKYGSNNFFEGLGEKAIKEIFNLNVRIVTSVN